jgi:hypothetical protein
MAAGDDGEGRRRQGRGGHGGFRRAYYSGFILAVLVDDKAAEKRRAVGGIAGELAQFSRVVYGLWGIGDGTE